MGPKHHPALGGCNLSAVEEPVTRQFGASLWIDEPV